MSIKTTKQVVSESKRHYRQEEAERVLPLGYDIAAKVLLLLVLQQLLHCLEPGSQHLVSAAARHKQPACCCRAAAKGRTANIR